MKVGTERAWCVRFVGVLGGLLGLLTGTPGWTQEALPAFVEVAVSVANLRQGPSLQSPIVARLPKGTVLEVLGREGDWYRVRLTDPVRGRVEGYIARRLVTPVGSAPPTPSTEQPPKEPTPPTEQPPKPPKKPTPPPPSPRAGARPPRPAPSRPWGVWVSAGLLRTSIDHAGMGFGLHVGALYMFHQKVGLLLEGTFGPVGVDEASRLGGGRFQVRSIGGGPLFEPARFHQFVPVLTGGVLFHMAGFRPEADFTTVGLEYQTSVKSGVGFFVGGGLRAEFHDRVHALLLVRKAFYSVRVDVTQTDVVTGTKLSAPLEGVGVHPLCVDLGVLFRF